MPVRPANNVRDENGVRDSECERECVGETSVEECVKVSKLPVQVSRPDNLSVGERKGKDECGEGETAAPAGVSPPVRERVSENEMCKARSISKTIRDQN